MIGKTLETCAVLGAVAAVAVFLTDDREKKAFFGGIGVGCAIISLATVIRAKST
jgi:hypothetical protein